MSCCAEKLMTTISLLNQYKNDSLAFGFRFFAVRVDRWSPGSLGMRIWSSVLAVAVLAFCLAQGLAQSPNQSTSVSSVPSWFTHCAGENGQCSFTGPAQVIFGTASGSNPVSGPNGSFSMQTLNGGTVCSGSVFGDPAPGQAKACWAGPVANLGTGSIVETGGSNYTFYVQNFGSWDDNQRVVVGLYHLDPTLVEAQLRQMYASGQKKVALFIWYMPFESSLSPGDGIPLIWPDVYGAYINSSGGRLSDQAQSNLQAILGLVQQIGFNQVTLRFGPIGAANPRTWGNTWNESVFEEDEQFAFNTRQLAENTLAGSSIKRLYDLGVEQAGVPHYLNQDGVTYTDGQAPQWTSRLWADYVRLYGGSDSYGFSIAYSYGTLQSAIAEYDAAGTRPSTYAVDVYGTGAVWNIYQELLAAGESTKQVIIQETQYNDAGIMQDFQTALQHIPLTISYIDQWPTNSNTPNADGMSPPTNYGMYGGTTTPSGTLVGYPCTVTVGQSTCTTVVSWSTSNSSSAALYVNGVQAVNLPNITGTLTGTATITLSLTPTTLVLVQNPNGLALPASTSNTNTQLNLTAISGTPPTLFRAGLGGVLNQTIWIIGSNISSGCSVNLYDPNGSASVPVASVTNVSCQSNSLAFAIPVTVANNYAAISLRVVNQNGLSSGQLTVALEQIPKLTAAGLGGTLNQTVWAVGAGITSGCMVNLYDPNGSATVPIASITNVYCQSNSLSFDLPASIVSSYSAISFSVVDSDGLSSGQLTVALPNAQRVFLTAAGLGGTLNQDIWAIGSGISSGCMVNLYDPNGSATVPIARIANVSCQSNSLSFQIPASVVASYGIINLSVVNPNGFTSGQLTVALQSVP